MGRKEREAITVEAQAMDLVAAEKREDELTAAKALELYGDGQPYERLRYTEEVKSLLELTGRSIMETGKRLIVLKANESHGGWIQTLEQVGLPYRSAARFIHVARRFGKYANLAHLNTSKLEALEDFTDPELQDLNDGKDVLGLNLDEIERTTATKLRNRLRSAEKKLTAQKERHEQTVKEMSAELETLRLRDSNLAPPTKERKAAAALEELRRKLFTEIQLTRFHFGECMKVIDTAQKVEDVTYPLLEQWAREEYSELADFQPMLEELDEALQYVNPDKGESDED